MKSCNETSVISEFKSSSSSLTDEVSSDEIRAQMMRITDAVAPCKEMKLNVVRRSRSKLCRCSNCKKIVYANVKQVSSNSEYSEDSCVSSSSSSGSSARSSYITGSKDFMTIRKE